MDVIERQRRAAAEANEWWLQMREGEVSRAQREQFVDWLRESPLHVKAMLKMAQVQGSLERFKGWDQIGSDGWADFDETVVELSRHPAVPTTADTPEGNEERERPRRRVGLWSGAMAASALAVLVAGGWLYRTFTGETIETRLGERREISLSDGTHLQVDPETRLRVRFAKEQREITLEHGRTFFRVSPDPKRPFVVKASDTIVRVLGTSFAVDQGRQGTTVTVVEGKVSVSSALSGAAITQPAQVQPASTVLVASQQLTMSVTGRPKKVLEVDAGRELAWAEGRLVFDKTPVAAALAQFNRYNRLQLRVTGEALSGTPITGVFDASEPESFVRFLKTVRDVEVVRDEGDTPSITLAEAR